MLHSKRGVTKKKAGFSLIELLVVVAIIGILAAVAIPAYNNYRVTAVQGAITASLQSVAKGFAACLTLNNWANCNSIQKMNVSCPDCSGPVQTGTSTWCTHVERSVGGTTYRGCIQSSGGVPTILGNWPVFCNTVEVTYTCNSGGTGYTAPNPTCATLGCTATATAPASSGITCTANSTQSHACTTANSADQTNSGAATGTCAANGTCS